MTEFQTKKLKSSIEGHLHALISCFIAGGSSYKLKRTVEDLFDLFQHKLKDQRKMDDNMTDHVLVGRKRYIELLNAEKLHMAAELDKSGLKAQNQYFYKTHREILIERVRSYLCEQGDIPFTSLLDELIDYKPGKADPSAQYCEHIKNNKFLWGLMPKWVRDEVPGPEHAWDPMWFGTGSRKGDIDVQKRVKRILNIK